MLYQRKQFISEMGYSNIWDILKVSPKQMAHLLYLQFVPSNFYEKIHKIKVTRQMLAEEMNFICPQLHLEDII